MMAVELLKRDPASDPKRSRVLDTIDISSRRGSDLVRQVLSFARGLDSKRVLIRLRNQVEELHGIISEIFPRDIRIVVEVPTDLWPITGDPIQLHQVLLNLAVNARDAMPHGGTLTLSASNLNIDAQYAGMTPEAKAGPHVLLKVSDTGVGIAPEVRERIFEPFFTTKELGKGTGIGLATVHTVAKSHGGFVSFESELGRGTTFKVYLPADPAYLTAETERPAVPDLPAGRDELVLVVDDEYAIREITQQTLETFGYRVMTARDGAEAVALYVKHAQEIAIVLTDMMMPVMDGAATIQVLRRINPAVRIIAASGIDSGDPVANAGIAGVGHFLLKPFTAECLLTLMRTALDKPAGGAG
jgi:CheY-like chemotaxis protein